MQVKQIRKDMIYVGTWTIMTMLKAGKTGRPAGRPKSRWDDDVRNDLKKMKLVKWAEQVQDRSKRKAIVEKAKTLSELHHRRRRLVC
jgi:hypothetical protein